MLGSEAILRVMESEGDEFLEKMSGKGYQFPSEFNPEATSRLVQRIKYRFTKGYWDLRGRATVQEAAVRRLQEVNVWSKKNSTFRISVENVLIVFHFQLNETAQEIENVILQDGGVGAAGVDGGPSSEAGAESCEAESKDAEPVTAEVWKAGDLSFIVSENISSPVI